MARLICSVPFMLISFSYAQSIVRDTSFVSEATTNVTALYDRRVGVHSNLYNGSEYQESRPRRDQYPFMLEDWANGSVVYSGESYENIPLLYDIQRDLLITSYVHGSKIHLIKPKVERFSLEQHHFIRLENGVVPEGFYNVLYDGMVKFYVKRQKTLIKKLNGNVIESEFEDNTKYYIIVDGHFNSVRSKHSVLSVLKDRKHELKKFLRDNKIYFGGDRENSIVRMLSYYDQIKP